MTTATEYSNDSPGVRERIAAAALEELSRRGFAATSVHEIARRAGVTAAMINYYFGGKRALYEGVLAEAQARLHARLAVALERGDAGQGVAPRLAGAYFDFLAEERQMQRLLLREVLDAGDDARHRAPELVRPLREILELHLGRDEHALQSALSLFGAIAAYFIYEPVLGELLDRDPLSADALARRRSHIVQLASTIQEPSR